MSDRARLLRSHIADERRLILEKSALEIMLKNLQSLRNKLKVEQVQLSSLVQNEMGQDPSLPFSGEVSTDIQEASQPDIVAEVELDTNKLPALDLDVSSVHRKMYSIAEEEDEEEEDEEEDEDDEDDDEDDEVMCAMEVIEQQIERDIGFENY